MSPIYLYKCIACGSEQETIQVIGQESPTCDKCGGEMSKQMSPPAIIRIIWKGGYPKRSQGYKDGYSKEYLRDVSPETNS